MRKALKATVPAYDGMGIRDIMSGNATSNETSTPGAARVGWGEDMTSNLANTASRRAREGLKGRF